MVSLLPIQVMFVMCSW